MIIGHGRLKFRQCVLFLVCVKIIMHIWVIIICEHFLQFSDILLITVATTTGSYKIKQKLALVDMRVWCFLPCPLAPVISYLLRFQAWSPQSVRMAL